MQARMYAPCKRLPLHFIDEMDWRKMWLLLWLLTWFVWRVMGTITTQRFFAPQIMNMKITSPSVELVVRSEIECAISCVQNSTCLSFSVTQYSGSTTCLFGYRFDEPRTAEASSKFFYRDMPIPAGYDLVPGTRSYVKLTKKTISEIDSQTACKQDHAELVSSSDAAVYNYTNQLWTTQAFNLNIWVGGRSLSNTLIWAFPDGESSSVALD
ncbi:unnamed protein product [Darwinula stevensoni]|uniref:Apple domain-containing protein n=1 Tax=Darwinula stevensoni TaxID=69355 RepID=A0A7R9A5M0_9CRUS|nr:unnamed protein product [Darwinula stevensoni]CAG0885552.1 unnamed protein product [Darwinula stevensoni]